MRTEQRTVTTIIADEGKLLRRKSDGWVAGEQVTLGYNYYEGGVGLSEAKLETPEDYEEIDRPADYEEPQIIDQVKRIMDGLKLQENVNRRMEEETENINSLNLSDSDSLKVKDVYPEWEAGLSVKVGEKYRVGEDLWKVVQSHTTQESWKPSLSTASLWERVDETHEGTADDPITYTPPMQIYNGKYYTQNGVEYKCTRDSGIALSHDLSALVGLYVEIV
jgi:hypothetical protein